MFSSVFWIVYWFISYFLEKEKTCSRKNSEFICVVALYYCEGIPFRILWKRKLCWSKKIPYARVPCTVTYGLQRPCGGTARIPRVNLRFSWVMTLEYTCFGGPTCLASKIMIRDSVSLKRCLLAISKPRPCRGTAETLLGKLGFPIGKLPPMWLHNIRASYW